MTRFTTRFGHWTAIATLGLANLAHADTTLLNVSYDVTRELYKDIDAAFIADYKQRGPAKRCRSGSLMARRARRRFP
jgi:ABC-type sulfate transport system substrate-binding protein